MAEPRIVTLSATIARQTAVIVDYCQRNNIPTPSFDLDAPPTVDIAPGEHAVLEAKDSIIAATRELGQLMKGPAETVTDIGFVDAFTFQAISRYNIASHVPVGSEATYDDISKVSGLNVNSLRRVLRFVMSNGFFVEPRPNYVAHTSASRLLAENELFRAAVAMTFDENFPASTKATEALSKTEEYTSSGWSLANNAQLHFYQELQQRHPTRHRDMVKAMDAWSSWLPVGPINKNYPWSNVKKMVDIGGGHGQVSLSIARHDPTPQFVVQDLPNVVANGPAIPTEFTNRITFMAHDMFDEQPVKDADVYFFRSVLHDWPDNSVVRILKALIPALKPGARVVIHDPTMPPPGTLSPRADRAKHLWDLHMMLLFNSRDREEAEWASLFEKADSRFKFLGSRLPTVDVDKIPPSGLLSIIEAEWQP
ncbi:O-methyltransferase [Myriangium duriaei CBS 260.36]|uniref:O-methyltransferase n=1 Tax=Myriangium duriaei CBS 260.36 TaxID=1168546 RepID=A0A9P4MBN3_9PEZI|nr:O-methyltransferase [Myriangium duriaei CBS 260.36]